MHHAHIQDSMEPKERDMNRFGGGGKVHVTPLTEANAQRQGACVSRHSMEAAGQMWQLAEASLQLGTDLTLQRPPPSKPHLELLSGWNWLRARASLPPQANGCIL